LYHVDGRQQFPVSKLVRYFSKNEGRFEEDSKLPVALVVMTAWVSVLNFKLVLVLNHRLSALVFFNSIVILNLRIVLLKRPMHLVLQKIIT
jgi:hypothetical protein